MKSFNLGTDGETEWHYGRGMEGETRGENSLIIQVRAGKVLPLDGVGSTQ